MRSLLPTAALCVALPAAAAPFRPFPDADPVWVDADENNLAEKPDEYWSGLYWDGADQTVFLPMHRFLTVQTPKRAFNVNSWDEVPNSSWFTNRIGVRDLSPEQVARGPCPDVVLNPDAGKQWVVKAAKPNGANPGFIIQADDGSRYLLKMDGHDKPERATTADVLGSKVYWAAGYYGPCNLIIEFDRDIFVIDDGAETEDEEGNDIPMEQHHIDEVLAAAVELDNGKLRASASLFIEGRPWGPWTYQGVRKDDPNDLIPHEHRRELRGSRILAAWLNHFDSREQNTLSTWVEQDGRGFIRHYFIDFGDCLGSSWLWAPELLSRRFGQSYYLDFTDVLVDLATFGAITRPWETVQVRDEAPLLGFYDVEHFDPTGWKSGYPNPAFTNMDDEDGAWMARILARFTDAHIAAALAEGRMSNPAYEAETLRVLIARRDMLLDHYLRVRSPLADFELEHTAGSDRICFRDLASDTGVTDGSSVTYHARMYLAGGAGEPAWTRELPAGSDRCVAISGKGMERPGPGGFAVLDLLAQPAEGDPLPPSRLHLYDHGEDGWRLAGIERPRDDRAPRF